MVKFLNTPKIDSDVEDIMNSINDYILYNKNDIMSLNDSNYNAKEAFNKLKNYIFTVNQSYNISTSRKIVCTRKRFGGFVVFTKKVIRKFIRWYLDDVTSQQVEHNASVTKYLNEVNYIIQYLYTQNIELKNSISELESKLNMNKNSDDIDNRDEFYLDFENTFRGSFELIKQRISFYLPHFVDRKSIIDIGCGRGEFLELMNENNISAIGIDSNNKMVEACKKKGLNVIHDDGIEYLTSINDDSVDGIFASQVVEHLSFEQLEEFLIISHKKLQKSGCLIIETVNPLTLGVYCYSFHIDPTHIKPVHPATLRFMLERIGFDVKPIQFLNHFPDNYKLTLDDNMDDIEKENINRLNETIFGAQDYAIICEKR